MTEIRAGFVTCVDIGLSCIREIFAVGGSLDCVLTLPDGIAPNKSGRVYLDDFCREQAVELFKVRNINDGEAVRFIADRRLDWLFIIGWSQIARAPLLATPRRGVLGMHPTLLPEGRGRAAIPWAILKRLTKTGVTLFQLDEGVDTGPILAQQEVPMSARETATELYAKVATAHRDLIRHSWPAIARDEIEPRPQDDRHATLWPGRTPDDGRLTATMRVSDVELLVRATTRPYPGAFMDLPEGRLRVWAGFADVAGSDIPAVARSLTFADGTYHASEFALEPLPT